MSPVIKTKTVSDAFMRCRLSFRLAFLMFFSLHFSKNKQIGLLDKLV